MQSFMTVGLNDQDLADTGLTAAGNLHADGADLHVRRVKWQFSTRAGIPHRL
jgi:hypothetical protein